MTLIIKHRAVHIVNRTRFPSSLCSLPLEHGIDMLADFLFKIAVFSGYDNKVAYTNQQHGKLLKEICILSQAEISLYLNSL